MATMIFMMGLPAAGKSTIRSRLFDGVAALDPDEIKAEYPDYDPRNAFLVHERSMVEFETRFQYHIVNKPDVNLVVDGTGTNSESMVRRISLAKSAGFQTTLVYVRCTLETSLKRARQRERQVPESVIRQKALEIETSFALVSPHVDSLTIIHND